MIALVAKASPPELMILAGRAGYGVSESCEHHELTISEHISIGFDPVRLAPEILLIIWKLYLRDVERSIYRWPRHLSRRWQIPSTIRMINGDCHQLSAKSACLTFPLEVTF